MSETKLVKEILVALSAEKDFICWRNNTGKLADVNGRWVTYGLGVGSADIIGVLSPWGLFVALEVKTPTGRKSKHQKSWEDSVRRVFGFYRTVHDKSEALAALEEARAYMYGRWEESLPY